MCLSHLSEKAKGVPDKHTDHFFQWATRTTGVAWNLATFSASEASRDKCIQGYLSKGHCSPFPTMGQWYFHIGATHSCS